MINIVEKKDCVGCGACVDACGTHAIHWNVDTEGFWYPIVEIKDCVNCGNCERVCPIINAESLSHTNIEPPKVYAAYNKNQSIRKESTTGGLFSAFAEKVFADNGYIGGAIWTDSFSAKHVLTNDPESITAIRGSKYIQSDSTGLFKQVKQLLKQGNKVLVCGTPCQMAALRQFVGKTDENLILIDFVCSSVNSPMVFRKYVESLEKQYGSKMVSYHPKNKEYGGWHNFAFKAVFENGKVYLKNKTDDDFTHCFIGSHVVARPSCFSCKFKSLPRIADITIADFWGIENVNPDMDSPLGTSLLIVNNEKGAKFYDSVRDKLVCTEQTLEEASRSNANLYKNLATSPVDRNVFYRILDSEGFKPAVRYSRKKMPKESFRSRVYKYVKKIMSR